MMINKYNRVFFAPNHGDVAPNHGDMEGTIFNPLKPFPNPLEPSHTVTKKKRNLVAISTPLIIKLTPYKKEETWVDGTSGEETTETVTYYKINKSFNQILDAYLIDRTIKIYTEQETPVNEEITEVNIESSAVLTPVIRFTKTIKDNKSVYEVQLGKRKFYSASPNAYMTTELSAFAEFFPTPDEHEIPSPGEVINI